VHTQLLCRFALIAAMTRKNLEDVLLLKLAHRVGVSDTSGVHLEDEVVEFAFQSRGLPFSELAGPGWDPASCITLLSLRLQAGLDPIRCRVLEVVETVKQTLFEIGGHDEGYSMSGPKKIWSEMRIFNPWGAGQKCGYCE
jgi:hypothetical protein